MLAMPDLLRTLALVFDRMQSKHRAMVEALRGRWTPEESDALIASIDDEARDLAALLSDKRRCAASWVTLPEPMAVAETADALQELQRLQVHVDTVVINRVTPAPDRPCRWCSGRRAYERAAVESLLAMLTDQGALESDFSRSGSRPQDSPRIATVESRPTEPRGLTALAAIAAEMDAPPCLPRVKARAVRVVNAARSRRGRAVLLTDDPVSLLMFGGKGGVGKTTCAAAAAVGAAAERPGRPVLLLSSDPAHSLADVLGVTLADEPVRIAGAPSNLKAREIDAAARFASIKQGYGAAIDAVFERVVGSGALNMSADRQSMRDLMELAPPGIDELMAMVEVSDALESAGAMTDQLVVLDTAPSGHALRLLEMPALVHAWVRALMGILLKYQPVVGIGELGPLLLHMSQGLGRLRARLADPSRSAFIAVTRPAGLPVAETTRLVRRLRAIGIHVPAVLVNAVGAGTCRRCATTAREQQRALTAIRRGTGGRGRGSRTVAIAPAVVPPPHGPEALGKWRRSWTVD
jgi:arsenite-transporting ATPase